MFWPRVKLTFLNNLSLFIALLILAIALAVYFPSLGQESRLIEKRDALNKESLASTEKLDEAILLRDNLLDKTQGMDYQVETWEKRTEILESYLIVKVEELKNE